MLRYSRQSGFRTARIIERMARPLRTVIIGLAACLGETPMGTVPDMGTATDASPCSGDSYCVPQKIAPGSVVVAEPPDKNGFCPPAFICEKPSIIRITDQIASEEFEIPTLDKKVSPPADGGKVLPVPTNADAGASDSSASDR